MYKIAVLGDRDSIYGFATLGLETFPVTDPDAGADTLKRLAMTDYAVIYITESLKAQIEDEIEKFRDQKLPAIIPIPGVSGNTGQGMVDVKRLVEQAVGSDIIFNNDN
ncbi:MAG: V-type ATP synthase subunit F [Parasporobacterium sp.]|nr:V-type ATP synthase subunit F [Parasporobacterium sp.]